MKALVVLSGGMDSATALGLCVNHSGKENVSTITFNYGSKHNAKENAAAQALARYYGVENKIVTLGFIGELFKSDLLQSGGDVPEGHYAEENMKKTVVPFRNPIMLAIAAGYAASIGNQALFVGTHFGDHAIYPDCREEFMVPFAEAISKGDWSNISLRRPFEKYTKAEIARLGISLEVPYGLTWTCYKGGIKHCGKCGSCVERLASFAEVGVEDPVAYEDRESYKAILERGPKA